MRGEILTYAHTVKALCWLEQAADPHARSAPLLSCTLLLQIRDLYMTFRNFKARIADFLRFRCAYSRPSSHLANQPSCCCSRCLFVVQTADTT